jgi:two-component system OmpR family response regulator
LNILMVEDDVEASNFVAEALSTLGHRLEVVPDGRTGLVRGASCEFDCLVVDRMLPGYDGLALVKALRTSGVRTPIILLTALGGVADRIEGLRAGADDYLVKPFDVGELEARLEALRRRPPLSNAATVLRAGGVAVDRLGRTANLDGNSLDLTQSEFKILEVLLLNAGRPVTKAMLLEAVFDLSTPTPASIIEPHISRLRVKLERPGGGDPIRTVRGLGYIIDAD